MARGFADFRDRYPKRLGMGKARGSYAAAVARLLAEGLPWGIWGEDPHAFLADRAAELGRRLRGRDGTCWHATTWLADEHYHDDPAAWDVPVMQTTAERQAREADAKAAERAKRKAEHEERLKAEQEARQRKLSEMIRRGTYVDPSDRPLSQEAQEFEAAIKRRRERKEAAERNASDEPASMAELLGGKVNGTSRHE
jgi:hypothetical protein